MVLLARVRNVISSVQMFGKNSHASTTYVMCTVHESYSISRSNGPYMHTVCGKRFRHAESNCTVVDGETSLKWLSRTSYDDVAEKERESFHSHDYYYYFIVVKTNPGGYVLPKPLSPTLASLTYYSGRCRVVSGLLRLKPVGMHDGPSVQLDRSRR